MKKQILSITFVMVMLAVSMVVATPTYYVGHSTNSVAQVNNENIIATKAKVAFNTQSKTHGSIEIIGTTSNNDRVTLSANIVQTSSEVYCYEGKLYFHGVYTGTATYWKKGAAPKTLKLRTVLIDYDLSGKQEGIVQGYSNEQINFEVDNIPIVSK